jgi:hypothetical protein
MATQAQRAHIAAVTKELSAQAARLAYPPNDVRTSLDAMSWNLTEHAAFTLLEAGHVLQYDCSEMYAWVLRCAGCWHQSQPGYTGTDLTVLQPHYTNAKEAEIGAGVIFGPGTGHHVAWVIRPDPKGGNPGLAGHGRPGFTLNTLAQEAAVQAELGYPGVTFCSIAHA